MELVLKKLECQPSCGFLIRSHDEWEIITAAIQHAKEKHGIENVDVEELRANIEVAHLSYDADPH